MRVKRPDYSGRSLDIFMIFLKATAMPKNMQTNRSTGEVLNSRSNNQPTSAPPAGPAISSVRTLFPCRIPLAGTWSEPERVASAFRAAFSFMSNESSRASLLPFLSCPELFETMRFVLNSREIATKSGQPRLGTGALGESPRQVNSEATRMCEEKEKARRTAAPPLKT
jgi:hypothetical protein